MFSEAGKSGWKWMGGGWSSQSLAGCLRGGGWVGTGWHGLGWQRGWLWLTGLVWLAHAGWDGQARLVGLAGAGWDWLVNGIGPIPVGPGSPEAIGPAISGASRGARGFRSLDRLDKWFKEGVQQPSD